MMRIYGPKAETGSVTHAKTELADAEEASEIYSQNLNGRMIERLSRRSGFDGDPEPVPATSRAQTPSYVFSSGRSADRGVHLYRVALNGSRMVPLTRGPVIDRGASYSPDGRRLVWFRQDLNDQRNQTRLIVGDGQSEKTLPLEIGANLHPVWHPSGDAIVFASNRAGSRFNLYSIDPEGKCLKRITDSDFDQLQPAISADGKYLLFTSRHSGQLHLYLLDYRPPSDCLDPRAAPAPGPSTTWPTGKEYEPPPAK
jgi:Tol biopolymer transport system component